MEIPEVFQDLEAAYKFLRIVNKRFGDEMLEFFRLNTVKHTYFPTYPTVFEVPEALVWYSRRGFGNQIPSESEWWAKYHSPGTSPCEQKLNVDLARVAASALNFEDIRSKTQNRINELSRPYLRDLGILDLPNEVLLGIFDLEDFTFSDTVYDLCPVRIGFEDIKNARLVCRRFHDLVSPQLHRFVRVDLDDSSLGRLEEISHHPMFAQGVRVIHIVPHFYNPVFADFNRFMLYNARKLELECRYSLKDNAAQARAVASTLERFGSGDNIDGSGKREGDEHRARLGQIHQEYLTRLRNQELLVKSGKFSRVIASAMARMPSARELQFRDEYIRRENVISSSYFSGDIWNALPRFMLRPMCGKDSVLNHFELPSYQCLAELLKTFGQTGVFLSSMVVDLATKGGPGSLVLAPDMRKEVSLGMQQLKNLEVVLRSWVANEDPDAGDLTEFVSAILDTASLQKVVLAANDWDWNHAINIGKAMGSRSRENLNYVSLQGTPIHLSELIGLLGSMSEQISLRMNVSACLAVPGNRLWMNFEKRNTMRRKMTVSGYR
jgi:hypothetical protein